MFCRLNNVKRELLNVVLDPDLKVISLYINNAVSVSYFHIVNCVKSVRFLLLILLEVVVIYYL